MNVMIDEELDLIISNFTEEGLGPREYGVMDSRLRSWTSALRDVFEPQLIEVLAMDTYLYFENGDLWTNYIKKQRGKQRRSKIIEVLNEWQHPFLLLGKIVSQTGHSVTLRDEITGETHTINGDQAEKESHIGKWLFGIVLPDSRRGPKGLIGTDGLIFIPEYDSHLVDQLIQKLKGSKLNYLDMYQLFVKERNNVDFTPFQQEVLELATQFLTQYQFNQDMVMNILTAFLIEQTVKAKKASAVAAGAIQVAIDFGLIEPTRITQKEIAAHFNVSSTTLVKYRDQMTEFVVKKFAQLESEEPELYGGLSIVTEMGTDPRATERFMWEMVMRTQHQPFDTLESLNTFMNDDMNAQYKPVNDQEHAQLLCYQAYEANSDEKRNEYTFKAEKLDSDLADVHLLKAEQSEGNVVIENHYLKAIRAASKNLDESFDEAWNFVLNRPYLRARFSYGTWLMSQNRYEEALDQLQTILKINPVDHQCVRWLIVRALIQLGLHEEALNMLFIINPDLDDVFSYYFELAIAKKVTKQKVSKELLENFQLNPYIKDLLKEGKHPGAFPRSLNVEPGNRDEAKLVYWLVYGLL